MKNTFLGLLFLVFVFPTYAQVKNTSVEVSSIQTHSPSKAIIFSSIIPGLDQIYNKKYWKLPFIYGAGGAFAYGFGYNQLQYRKFRKAVFVNQENKTRALIDGRYYNYEQQLNGQNYYRRNRDLCTLGYGAIYILNIIDAMVDAHFYYFDVSDDLSLRWEPAIIESMGMKSSLGLRMNLSF